MISGQKSRPRPDSAAVPVAQESDLSPKVALDMEAAKLAESVLQYQAVTKAYNQMTSLLNIAINEGKR